MERMKVKARDVRAGDVYAQSGSSLRGSRIESVAEPQTRTVLGRRVLSVAVVVGGKAKHWGADANIWIERPAE